MSMYPVSAVNLNLVEAAASIILKPRNSGTVAKIKLGYFSTVRSKFF